MNIRETDFLKSASDSKDRFELWQQILSSTHARTVAEVGVWKGDFAKAILENCETIEKYYLIDPWATLLNWNKPFNVEQKIFDEIYEEALGKLSFASEKIVVLRGQTKDVINQIPDASLDFAYIDGDHTLRGITLDLINVLPKIKEGALLAGDDFAPNPWQHNIEFEPTLVCPFSVYFAEAMGIPIVALPHNQFLIQKKQGVSFSFDDPTGKYSDLSLNKLPPQRIKRRTKNLFRRAEKKLGF